MTTGTKASAAVAAGNGRLRLAVVLLGIFLLSACAGVPPAPPPPAPPPEMVPEAPPPPDPFRGVPGTLRERALRSEADGNPRKAVILWKAVLRLVPGDGEASGKVASLSARLFSEADAHFRKGAERLNAGDAQAARREFLLALAFDPGHPKAREFLKNRVDAPDVLSYETRAGDTLRRIAKERYGDPDKDVLIAYFNDMDRNAVPPPGTTLKLPVLETVRAAEPPEKPPKDILSYPKENDQAEAERLYRSGLRRFQAGEWEKAASEWEKALRFDPEHAKARKDLDRVRRMLEKLK